MPTLFWFDRDDRRLGLLHPLSAVVHTEALLEDDTIEFWCEEMPEKYDRILWRDPQDGRWREHVVVSVVEDMGIEGAKVIGRTCLCDFKAVYIEELRLEQAKAYHAVPDVLGELYPDRWGAIVAQDSGLMTGLIYHMNALDALHKLEIEGEVEFEPVITADAKGVRSRRVRMKSGGIGDDHGVRLVYGKNLTWCRRTLLDTEVFTALYGWGMGMPLIDDNGDFTGGYMRRLTMENATVPGSEGTYNCKYVEDGDALERWGVKVGDTRVHRFGEVFYPDETNPNLLKRKAENALQKLTQPRVVYEANACLVADGEPIGLGDRVQITDTTKSPVWELKARVIRRVRTMGVDAVETLVDMGTVTWRTNAELEVALHPVTGTENAGVPTVTSGAEPFDDTFGGVRPTASELGA